MLAQAECEKALEAWIDEFVGANDDEKGGGKYIRGNAGVFTNVCAALNRRRLSNYKTEAERAIEPDPPPPPRPKRAPPAKRPTPPSTPVPTPGARRSKRTPAKAKENKHVLVWLNYAKKLPDQSYEKFACFMKVYGMGSFNYPIFVRTVNPDF